MPELEVDVPGIPPSPNGRFHWSKLARLRRDFRGWTMLAALDALSRSGHADDYPLRSARLEPIFFVRTTRRRDPDNLLASLKPLVDGLVDAGVLEDDDRIVYGPPSVKVTGHRGYEGVALYVTDEVIWRPPPVGREARSSRKA